MKDVVEGRRGMVVHLQILPGLNTWLFMVSKTYKEKILAILKLFFCQTELPSLEMF